MVSIKSSTYLSMNTRLLEICTLLWCISIGWSTALSNVIMVITTLFLIINFFYQKEKISIKEYLLFPSSILFILFALSTLWSNDLFHALDHLKSYLPFILYPITLIYWIKYQPDIILKGIKILIYSMLVAYIITIIWNIIPANDALRYSEYFGDWIKPYTLSNKAQFGWYVPFMERIHFSNILVYSGIASFFIYFKEKKLLYIILSIILLSSPFLLGARASLLGVILILPILLLFIFRETVHSKIWIFAIIGSIIISVVAYISYPNLKSRYLQTKYELESIRKQQLEDKDYQHFTTYTRFAAWNTAWKMYEEKTILGYGIGNYLDQYDINYQHQYKDLPICYHSQWLYFTGVFGTIGLILFLLIYLLYGYQLKDNRYFFYFIAFTLYTCMIWTFDTGLLQKKEMMAFVLFLSFAACLKKSDISST